MTWQCDTMLPCPTLPYPILIEFLCVQSIAEEGSWFNKHRETIERLVNQPHTV